MIGNVIKKYREETGISQDKFSERSGIKRVTISAMELGNIKSTSFESAIRIAEAMNISLEELAEKVLTE